MTLNVDLLNRVANHIADEPTTLDMGSFERIPRRQSADCQTTRCIAGWAVYLNTGQGWNEYFDGVWSAEARYAAAAEMLGLPVVEPGGSPLFYDSDWPAEYFRRVLVEPEAVVAVDLLRALVDWGYDAIFPAAETEAAA